MVWGTYSIFGYFGPLGTASSLHPGLLGAGVAPETRVPPRYDTAIGTKGRKSTLVAPDPRRPQVNSRRISFQDRFGSSAFVFQFLAPPFLFGAPDLSWFHLLYGFWGFGVKI